MSDTQYVRKRRQQSTLDMLKLPLSVLGMLGLCTLFYMFIALPPVEEEVVVAAPTPTALAVDAAVLGDPAAPLRITVFCDLASPDCGRFFTDLYPELKSSYVDNGQAALVFTHTPRARDARGTEPRRASAALVCAKNQSKLWEMFDAMMAKHSDWRDKKGEDMQTVLAGYAEELGLDTATYNTCVAPDNAETNAVIDKDIADAKSINAYGLYAVRINQRPAFSGFRDMNFLKTVIDNELKGQ